MKHCELTPAAVGRKVVYWAMHDRHRQGPGEEGVITSYNEHYAFVRFGRFAPPQAVRALDLAWSNERAPRTARRGTVRR